MLAPRKARRPTLTFELQPDNCLGPTHQAETPLRDATSSFPQPFGGANSQPLNNDLNVLAQLKEYSIVNSALLSGAVASRFAFRQAQRRTLGVRLIFPEFSKTFKRKMSQLQE